jgi:voltage-gated potassium channel
MKQHQHTRNNIILLVCLVATILFLPAMSSHDLLIKNILFTAIICSGTFSLDFVKRSQKILIVSGILTICLSWLNHFIANNVLSLVFASSFLLFNLFIVVFMIRHVAKSEKVDLTIIINSINGYLLLGILGALLLAMSDEVQNLVYHLDSETIHFVGGAAKGFHDYLYFSFVTLTTLGYGDITPVSAFAKSITLTIAVVGQFYMTILIAILVGKFLSNSTQRS